MNEAYDIVVIGGGIHGAGVAQAAAASGYSVLVLERSRPAAETSSRSSKLLHGGLRYLETFKFRLVYEALRERRLLTKNAPGLAWRVPFIIPVYADATRSAWWIRLGLSVYALLGGLHADTRFRKIREPEWEMVLGDMQREGLRAVYAYSDAQTDDAKLTEAVLRSGIDLGATVRFPTSFRAARRDGDEYVVRYHEGEHEREARCRVLVNAAGPWINEVQDHITPDVPEASIELVRGTHIVIDQEHGDRVFYIESPKDHRPIFVMPWRGKTLIGTTEVSIGASPPDAVKPTQEEIDYLLQAYRRVFQDGSPAVLESFAGLRVLPEGVEGTNSRSREVRFVMDDPRRPHYLGIYGGKLTTYRATAEKVIRLLKESLPVRKRIARTKDLQLK